MKRLCIYVTYDFEGVVDNYIGYMLHELRKVADSLVVVCNYRHIEKGIENIQPYADKIYNRENIGFDAGAFKDALCSFIGWDEILNYDELILMNDSFFGPFVPFKSIFDQMEERQNDFWGLTIQAETENPNTARVPEHIQSFFIAVQKRMLHSGVFRQYWEKLPYFNDFYGVVWQHELEFTGYFKERGFSYSALADTKCNDSSKKENNYSQYPLISYELIKKRNFPFLKRQQIAYNTLDRQTQENLRQAIGYISNHTDYDVNLIWDNIIRTMNVSDLQHSLHLQYIFSDEEKECKGHQDVAIAVSADYAGACEYVIEYLKPLMALVQIKVYAKNDKIRDFYQGCGIDCCRTSLDSYAELEKLSKFRYVCVIHDEDMTSHGEPSYIHKSSFYNIWGNLIKNKGFLERLIHKFDSEHKLGFLAPPPPNFGERFGNLGKGWDGQYAKCRGILCDKGIHCIVSPDKPPFAVSENCWVRGEIIRDIGRLADTDFGMLKYLWAFLAQEKGFYSGIVESTEYASINEVNKQYYLNEVCNQVRRQCGDFRNLLEMKKIIFHAALKDFCHRFTKVYIYGTGYMAERHKDMVPHMEGYLVSDGQPNDRNKDGVPVLYLSEIGVYEDLGVVVCVNEEHQRQVIPQLKAKGIKNYICI